MRLLIQTLIAIDQVFNALLGGWADETLSSRSYRQRHKKRWAVMEKIINAIFFWQKDHCEDAYWSEMERRQSFPANRTTSRL